jgi:hypothetical protein
VHCLIFTNTLKVKGYYQFAAEVEILNHYESLIKTESIELKLDKVHSRFVAEQFNFYLHSE